MSLLGNLGVGTQYWDEVLGTAAQIQNPALAQALAGAQQGLQNLAAQSQPVVTQQQPLFVLNVAREKLMLQVHELVRQLPLSIASSIHSCYYLEREGTEAARFVVVFSNRRTLTFYDVDAFPSDEHIGRIALECP